MVIDSLQTIFFHVPKCAGVSIEQFLVPGDRNYQLFNDKLIFGIHEGKMTQHLTYTGLKEYVPQEKLDTYFKFAFFRNTWDRLVSAYFYLKPHYDKKFGNFENLMVSVCQKVNDNSYQDGWHFTKQTDYLFYEGRPILDFIGHLENIHEDFKVVCERLGLPHKPLPQANASHRPSKSLELYTPKIISLVKEAYADEIEYFNYTFPQ